jgi:hypothetical protein
MTAITGEYFLMVIVSIMAANACRGVSKLTKDLRDPDVGIVIRSRNDDEHIRQLFEDIESQIFDGVIEVINQFRAILSL